MIFNKLTIRTKLNLGIGVLMLILGGLAFYLLVSINVYEEYVEDIRSTTDYNSIVEVTQLNDVRKVNFLRMYVSSRNPVLLDQIEVLSDTIFVDIERMKVLGSNKLILNALSNLNEDIQERQLLIDEMLEALDNGASDEILFDKLLNIDDYSSSIQVDLDQIREVSDVALLKQTERLDDNFYLNRLTSIVLIIIVSLFLLVISYVLVNSISIPLKKMDMAAKRIADGDFDFEINVNSEDEMGVLMNTFNDMRSKLNDYYTEMEDKVAERTIKLNETVKELNGTKDSLLGTLQILEEQKKDIEREKVRSEAILFNLGEGLVFLDLEGRVEFGNEAVSDLLGYKPNQYKGEVWYDLVQPSYDNGKLVSQEKLSFNILMDSPNKQKINVGLSEGHNYKKSDGATLPVSVVTSKVYHDNDLIGVILVFKDVSKEREVDKAKTEFVSLASHQLRTPLTSISWNTEMLINGEVGEVDEEQKVYLEEIYNGSKRLIDLVNSLLNTSRIDMGNFIVEPEDVDIVDYTKEIVKELDVNFEEKQIKLEASYDEVGRLMVDKKLYHILVENLLTNAIKYTPAGGIVNLELKVGVDGMMIKVSDNGFGIPESQKEQIFNKLFRADNVKAKDTDGTGLGLYLVKSIVDYIGGKIWFESTENVGSTFYIVIPKEGMKHKEGDKTLNTK